MLAHIVRPLAPVAVLATAVIVLGFLAFGDGGAKPKPKQESSHPFLIPLQGYAVDNTAFLEAILVFCAMALILAPVPLVALFAVRRMRAFSPPRFRSRYG